MTDLPLIIKLENKRKILDTAKDMLDGRINLIEGSRIINQLKYTVGDVENPLFNIFHVVSSDTESIPLDQKTRINFGEEYLRKSDEEMKSYLKDMEKSITEACSKLIQSYS
jgi:hypothetical protein